MALVEVIVRRRPLTKAGIQSSFRVKEMAVKPAAPIHSGSRLPSQGSVRVGTKWAKYPLFVRGMRVK